MSDKRGGSISVMCGGLGESERACAGAGGGAGRVDAFGLVSPEW